MANGSKMFIVGNDNDTVYAYDLSTDYDVSSASYDSESKDVSSEESVPQGIWFKPDGKKMFVVGNSNAVYAYTLSTAWDVSTASYDSVSADLSSEIANPTFVCFSADGSKMISGVAGDIFGYDLSTPWLLSSASYASETIDLDPPEGGINSAVFNDDGTKLYFVGVDDNTVYEYDLSTAYDVSSATDSTNSFSVNSEDTSPREIHFSDDGTKMFMVGNTNNTVYAYDLSTAWDVSTASYDSDSFSISSEEGTPLGLFFLAEAATTFTPRVIWFNPGGGGIVTEEFAPDDISGLQIWLDASDTSTIDTSTASPDVDSWTDKSSNGIVFSQGTAGKKPHTGTTVNGKNAISFDGINDTLRAGSAATLTGTEGNVFIVYKVGSVAATQTLLCSCDEASGTKWLAFQQRISKRTIQQVNSDTQDRLEADTTPVLSEVVLMMYASDGSNYTIRRNGASEGLTVDNGSDNGDWFGDTTNRDNIVIGSLRRSSEINYLNADMCEIIAYDGVTLTADHIAQVEGYLANKWGVTLP